MIGELPKEIELSGQFYEIRSDYRDILKILCAFNDPEVDKNEQVYICLYILYKDFDNLPQELYKEAFEKAIQFIDCNAEQSDDKPSPKLVDWEQDERIMFPAINKVAGTEIRALDYLHWWTFVGYYMEISDGIFAEVLNVRSKKAKHKKLEKWEQEFFKANRDICVIKPRLTEEEQAKKEALKKLLD